MSGWTTERIIAVLGAFFAGCSLLISTWNNTKLHTVETRQEVNTQKIDATQEAVKVGLGKADAIHAKIK